MKLCMFRTVPLPIIRSYSLYTQQWYMLYRLVDSCRAAGSGWKCSSILILLLESCLETCMKYSIAECTVNNSWRWAEELSETCRVSFQNKFWEISASSWFYYKEICHNTWSHERKKSFINHTGRSQVNVHKGPPRVNVHAPLWYLLTPYPLLHTPFNKEEDPDDPEPAYKRDT
jgi:hypothetical protein